jgi:hypothetical protein
MTTEIRELLELAAQAAEVSIHHQDGHGNIHTQDGDTWNPRESGDDLIELVGKLSIDVDWHNTLGLVTAFARLNLCSEYLSDHPTRKAALAMAVVRCAAEWQRRRG